jgi:NADPH2:quinone reductase
MGTMRAVVVEPDSSSRLAFREVEEPSPGRSEALVRVAASSLNRGEVRRAMACNRITRRSRSGSMTLPE